MTLEGRDKTSREEWDRIQRRLRSSMESQQYYLKELRELEGEPLLNRGLEYWKDRTMIVVANIVAELWVENDLKLQRDAYEASWDEAKAQNERYDQVRQKIQEAKTIEDLIAAVEEFGRLLTELNGK